MSLPTQSDEVSGSLSKRRKFGQEGENTSSGVVNIFPDFHSNKNGVEADDATQRQHAAEIRSYHETYRGGTNNLYSDNSHNFEMKELDFSFGGYFNHQEPVVYNVNPEVIAVTPFTSSLVSLYVLGV